MSGYSSRSHPGTRKATFQHHGDSSDLPSSAEEDLLTHYFDILVSESYDWWHFAIAFDYDKELLDTMKKCECEGSDDTGLAVEKKGNRIIMHLYCQIEYELFSAVRFPTGIAEEEDDESQVGVDFEEYRNLLINLKREILGGNYSSLHAIAEFYEPHKLGKAKYTKVGKKLQALLVDY